MCVVSSMSSWVWEHLLGGELEPKPSKHFPCLLKEAPPLWVDSPRTKRRMHIQQMSLKSSGPASSSVFQLGRSPLILLAELRNVQNTYWTHEKTCAGMQGAECMRVCVCARIPKHTCKHAPPSLHSFSPAYFYFFLTQSRSIVCISHLSPPLAVAAPRCVCVPLISLR